MKFFKNYKKNKITIVNIINKNKPKKDKVEGNDETEKDNTENNETDSKNTDKVNEDKRIISIEQEKKEWNEQTDEGKELHEDFDNDLGDIEDKIINKYYKIIALKCHPDKCKNEKFNKYFILAQEAYKKKEMLILLFIYAKTINDYKCVTKDELTFFSSIVDEIDKDQQNKCSSILYQWDRLTEEEKNMYIDDVKRKNNL